MFFWTVLSAQRSLQGGHLGILPHAWASGVLHGGGSRSAVRRHGSSQRRRRRTGSVRGPGTKGGISRRGKWLLAPAATVRAPAHQHFTRFSLFNHFISLHSSPSACPTVISVRSFFYRHPDYHSSWGSIVQQDFLGGWACLPACHLGPANRSCPSLSLLKGVDSSSPLLILFHFQIQNVKSHTWLVARDYSALVTVLLPGPEDTPESELLNTHSPSAN